MRIMKTWQCEMPARKESALGLPFTVFRCVVRAATRGEAVHAAAMACHEAGMQPGVIFVDEVAEVKP